MAGLNTTGRPRTSDYSLGRGKVYFAELENSVPKAYRDLGNCPEFSINVESETLEHASSQQGLKVVDKEVIISQKVNLSLTLDELNFENLALFFSGSAAVNTDPAGISTRTLVYSADGLDALSDAEVKGRWFDLYDSAGERVYNITLDVDQNTTTASTIDGKTAGVDYEMDLTMGRIFFYEAASGLAFTAGEIAIWVATSAAQVDEVKALTTTNVSGSIKFIAENPADSDAQTEYTFWSVSLKAEGDLSLIGDEFSTMQLTGVAEANTVAGGADSPTLTIRANPATP